MALSIAWLLDGELLTRSVAIDGSHIPSLEVTVAYEEWTAQMLQWIR